MDPLEGVGLRSLCRKHIGKRDSIHHHLLEAASKTANELEFRQKLPNATPSGWWLVVVCGGGGSGGGGGGGTGGGGV